MKTYNILFRDICEGLQHQGYEPVGGNDDSFLIMCHSSGQEIKIFLRDYKNTAMDDNNYVIVRFS